MKKHARRPPSPPPDFRDFLITVRGTSKGRRYARDLVIPAPVDSSREDVLDMVPEWANAMIDNASKVSVTRGPAASHTKARRR